MVLALGVVAPVAAQRAALEEHGRPQARPIVDGEPSNIEHDPAGLLGDQAEVWSRTDYLSFHYIPCLKTACVLEYRTLAVNFGVMNVTFFATEMQSKRCDLTTAKAG